MHIGVVGSDLGSPVLGVTGHELKRRLGARRCLANLPNTPDPPCGGGVIVRGLHHSFPVAG